LLPHGNYRFPAKIEALVLLLWQSPTKLPAALQRQITNTIHIFYND